VRLCQQVRFAACDAAHTGCLAARSAARLLLRMAANTASSSVTACCCGLALPASYIVQMMCIEIRMLFVFQDTQWVCPCGQTDRLCNLAKPVTGFARH
jgi:hypothetical protein